MRSSTIYRPDPRTVYTANGVTVTYMAGDTEGAYLIETDTMRILVEPARKVSSLMRSRIIKTQANTPDSLAAVIGGLILAGMTTSEISVEQK